MKRLNKDLKGINWDFSHQDVNDLFDNCHSKIQTCIDVNCPEKTVRVYDKQSIKEPWLTKGIIRSNKRQLLLYKKHLSHQCSHDQYKLYQSTLMRIKCRAKRDYYITLCDKYCSNTKMLWKILNEVISKRVDRSSVTMLKMDETMHYNKKKNQQ